MRSKRRLFILPIAAALLISAFLIFRHTIKETEPDFPAGVMVSGDSAYYPGAVDEIRADSFELPNECFPSYDSVPRIIKTSPLIYPEQAIHKNAEGHTKVRIWINKMGLPRLAVVSETSDTLFNKPSLIGAMRTVFKPAERERKSVSCWIIQPYNFRLQESNR